MAAGKPPAGAYLPVVRAGDFLFLSGQVPTDLATGELVGGDVARQTHAVIDRIEHVLVFAGARLSDVVSVSAFRIAYLPS